MKNIIKHLIAAICVVLVLLTVFGCGGNENTSDTTKDEITETTVLPQESSEHDETTTGLVETEPDETTGEETTKTDFSLETEETKPSFIFDPPTTKETHTGGNEITLPIVPFNK